MGNATVLILMEKRQMKKCIIRDAFVARVSTNILQSGNKRKKEEGGFSCKNQITSTVIFHAWHPKELGKVSERSWCWLKKVNTDYSHET